jgi:DNA-directed RNA polymerase II subunit RPB2
MISHGAAAMLKDRLLDQSDVYKVYVCDICGLLAIADLNHGRVYCRGCNNDSQISQVFLPYACKLLLQELMAMHIYPKLLLGTA